MKRIRHTPEQIIRKLENAEQLLAQGKTVADVCRALEVAQPTYHRWSQLYGGMQAEKAKRLTQLEKENGRLKRHLAEAELKKLFWVSGRFACRVVGQHRRTHDIGARLQVSRMPSCDDLSARSQPTTSDGASGWSTDCCAGKAGW